MSKLRRVKDTENPENVEYAFYCPGCQYAHWVRTKGPRPLWTWNGSVDAPTFAPSLVVGPGTKLVCHSFIRDGRIQFLPDSHHSLAGHTVEIPDWAGRFEDELSPNKEIK